MSDRDHEELFLTRLRLILAAGHTAAYDLRADISELLNERRAVLAAALVEPVPAPRLEWEKLAMPGTRHDGALVSGRWRIYDYGAAGFSLVLQAGTTPHLGTLASIDAAKSLAEKLQGVLDERA